MILSIKFQRKCLIWMLTILLVFGLWTPLAGAGQQSAYADNSAAVDEEMYPNLMENPGFESAGLAPWFSVPLPTSAERDAVISRSGEASMKFTPRVGQYSNVRQQLTLKRGVTYVFSAWARLNEAAAETVWLQMKLDYAVSTDSQYNPGGTSYPQVARNNDLGTDWVQLTGTHTYLGTNEEVTLYLYFEACQRLNCSFNVDDVYVYELPYAAAIEIAGDSAIPIPASGSALREYEAQAVDQYGDPVTEAYAIDWTYAAGPGVNATIGETFVLEASAEAVPGYVTLRAELSGNPHVAAEKRVAVGEPPPFAEHVAIAGELYEQPQLTASYHYVGYHPEGETSFEWHVADAIDGPYALLQGESSDRLSVDTALEGRYIRLMVIPVDIAEQIGDPVWSEPRKVLLPKSVYYVDPLIGDDSQDGTLEAPFATIEKARDEIRQFNAGMQGDITVYLRGGEYNYSDRYTARMEPAGSVQYEVRRGELVFDERDSGHNGYRVIYEAYPGETPVISGARRVTGWALHDPSLNIYRAEVGSDLSLRNLYVNGERAVVARSEGPPANLTLERDYGHTSTDTSMAEWNNIADVEFVYHSHWIQHRIKAHSFTVDNGLAKLQLHPPAWQFAIDTGLPSIYMADHLKYVENAYELLDTEGEWYYDRTSGELFYKPRSGENMATAEVVLPAVDELLTIEGSSLDQPVANVVFRGLSFEYTRWLRPNAARSHHANQNNVIRETNRLPEGAVTFNRAEGLVFERNRFSRMGSTGLLARQGIWSNEIVGNTFYDISGSAMNIGDHAIVTDAAVSQEERLMPRYNRIHNNYIRRIAVEYESGTGISMSLGQDNEILHNEISEIPYTGIHMSFHTDNWSKNQRIANNYIHDLLTTSIYDGGAIYALGTTRGSESEPGYLVENNYIRNQLNSAGALFPDNTTTWWLGRNNVIDLRDTPQWQFGDYGLNVHIHSVESANHVFDNFYVTTGSSRNSGTNNSFTNFHIYPEAAWPREAIQIIGESGLEPAYRDLWEDARFNAVRNSGFETRQTAIWQPIDAEWRASSAEHRSGVQSARVSRQEPDGHIRQSIGLHRDIPYDLSTWVKLEAGAAEETATLYLDVEGAVVPIQVADAVAHADGWTYLSGTYVYSGAEARAAAEVYVQLSGAGTSAYYVDDLQVIERREASPSVLQAAIAAAQNLHDAAVEGLQPGEYAAGAKMELAAGIADAGQALAADPNELERYGALRQLYAHLLRFASLEMQLGEKQALAELLTEAQALYGSAIIGTEPGMYPETAPSGLLDSIDAARQVYELPGASRLEVEQAVADLTAALALFGAQRIVLNEAYLDAYVSEIYAVLSASEEGDEPGQYEAGAITRLETAIAEALTRLDEWNPGAQAIHQMLGDREQWEHGTYSGDPWMDGLTGRGLKYVGAAYENEAFLFDMKYSYSGGDWPGFAIRSQSPDTTISRDETSYLFLFKRDAWELQKWVDGNREMLIGIIPGHTPRWGTLENSQIVDGQTHRVEFGAVDAENGVRLFMKIDGDTVFDHVDTEDPIRGAGYFAVYSTANPLHITPAGVYSEETLLAIYRSLQEALVEFEAARVPEQTEEPEPAVEIIYSANEPTHEAVVATLLASEPVTIINNGGSDSYRFLYNGSFTFIYRDAAGRIGEKTAEVGHILAASTGLPAAGVLSHDNGHDTGLLDGSYRVRLNLWWGNNAREFRLYEDGVLIDERVLPDLAPNAQSVEIWISGKANGEYRYRAELVNAHGTTWTEELLVTVRDANPGIPVLSHTNWAQGSDYTVRMDLWWGTNGTEYRLYENDMLIETVALADGTPHAQSVVTKRQDQTPGTYVYRAELINATGMSQSATLTVQVKAPTP